MQSEQTVLDSVADRAPPEGSTVRDAKVLGIGERRGDIGERRAKTGEVAGGTGARPSWRQAARAVQPQPRRTAYPRIREFERAVLPTLRTLRADYKCRICPMCSRPMIETMLPQHIRECHERQAQRLANPQEVSASDTVKQEGERGEAGLESGAKRDKPDKPGKPDSKELAKAIKPEREQKKRKRDDDKPRKSIADKNDDTGKKRTKTKPGKAKVAKPAKPAKEKPSQVYNPDKNCGVPLPNGQPCMRSLTCKQHPMGAKRAVPGRSMPYDVLLSDYHRQHQMRQAQQSAHAANAAQAEWDELQESQTQENPEREVQQVLEGVARAVCTPLARGEVQRSAFRAQNFRLREMLSMSLLPKKLPPTGELMYGRSLAFRPEAPDQFQYVRSQAVQQAVYVSQIQQQRQQQLRRQQQLLQKKDGAMGSPGGAGNPGIGNPGAGNSGMGNPGVGNPTSANPRGSGNQPVARNPSAGTPGAANPAATGATLPSPGMVAHTPLPQDKDSHPEAQSARLMAQQRLRAGKDQ